MGVYVCDSVTNTLHHVVTASSVACMLFSLSASRSRHSSAVSALPLAGRLSPSKVSHSTALQ